MPKEPPNKGKLPAAGEPSSKDVTSSQIVSTRELGAPPLPPPPARPPRRSTTHGVGWYAAEDGEDLAQPVRARSGKKLMIVTLAGVLLAGVFGGVLLWMRGRKASPAVAPLAGASDAAPVATGAAAAVRMVRLALASTPPGAELVVDGKPVGKAPAEIEVPEKARVIVEATLAQHAPWREEVVVASADKKVMAKLVPIVADAGPVADASGAAVDKQVTKSPVKKKVTKKKPTKGQKKKRPSRR